jgi:hypothetical protein
VPTRPTRDRRPPHAASQRPVPKPRANNPPTRAPSYEASLRVHCIHPSGLPLACGPGWNGSPWASPSSFTPRRCRRRMSRWGQTLVTCLSYVTINWSSNLRNYSLRAPSWRTPVYRTACGICSYFNALSGCPKWIPLPKCSWVLIVYPTLMLGILESWPIEQPLRRREQRTPLLGRRRQAA